MEFQSVKEVEETWRKLKFNVQQYTKGTSERGHILGAIDEVSQTLDDNVMQLQGMMSSRFIGPFLNSVQNWEKALSHISEVLEVRTAPLLASVVKLWRNAGERRSPSVLGGERRSPGFDDLSVGGHSV